MGLLERKRSKLTGKGGPQPFVGIPRNVADSDQFGALSGNAVKFIFEIARKYRGPGSNNGDLSLAWANAEARGWRSSGTLHRAKREAIEAGFVVCTRQGGKHKCSLFAMTFWPIDDCKGKHEFPPSRCPGHDWNKKSVVRMGPNVVRIRTNRRLARVA